MNGIGFWVVYAAFLIGLMYFVAIRPQNKEKKKMAELLASVAVGDTVLTSSGFYSPAQYPCQNIDAPCSHPP